MRASDTKTAATATGKATRRSGRKRAIENAISDRKTESRRGESEAHLQPERNTQGW